MVKLSYQGLQFTILRPDFFLLVDLRELFFRFRVGGGGGGGGGGGMKNKFKSSENDRLTGHFPCFFFLFFFLISPEKTVKLVRQTNCLF